MAGPGSDAQVQALGRELQHTKHRLQTTIEEMESSLEELKSANEELQSTNEEAMTNKEEMQSLNEELMTLNTQYLSKTEELSQAANDMKNLLDATEIAMRILPCRTLDNYISGAVITFIDITFLKTLETQLQAGMRFAESIVETMREPLLVLDANQRVLAFSGAFAKFFGFDPARIKGSPLHELDGGAWQQPALT